MKTIMTFSGVLLVLAAIAAIFYGGYVAIEQVWQLFMALDATLRLVALSSLVVVLLGALIIGGAIRSVAQGAERARLFDARLALYRGLLEHYENLLSAASASERAQQASALESLQVDIALLASRQIMDARQRLERAIESGADRDAMQSGFRRLVVEMRRDLGHRTLLAGTGGITRASGQRHEAGPQGCQQVGT
ncbi:MAG: hypothetical protein AW09_000667 [Candidatus Accumulibacter phosphatis]|uniref:Uncharacterized protein n=1 Tax=Candidatus Accumulibacter phosphatis TaxID=327160 RepID=A0A080LZ35_9PROT|nr:hypothetical protein [Accumulibacter sp.]KFB74036.1 MAG: hypothetical protein AW09_000667 [Candidatus Accumulibacter phosphatis]HRF06661.1 hypothetical protein [Accumulibacter sp.]